MKKYIIFTADIHPIGGMQMFAAGKAKYLEKHDWQVYIFFNGKPNGESEIPSLTKYIYGCGFEELNRRPYRLDDKTRNDVINAMIEILLIDPTLKMEIMIESHQGVLAYWAELLAERIHARHVFLPCNELFRSEHQYCLENLDFFYFKFIRRELITERQALIDRLFNGHRGITKNFMDFPSGFIIGKEQDPIQDIYNPLIDQIPTLDYNIAYVGRTEKSYVPAVFDGVAEFAKNHPDKKVQFVIVGKLLLASIIEKVQTVFTNIENLSVLLAGIFVPIPRSFFDKVDVVVAGSQTAIFCSYEKPPVIITNIENNYTAGCLYYDTNDTLYADVKYTYAEMLEKVLIKREYDNRKINRPEKKSSDWHYEISLDIQRNVPVPNLEYFTEKFNKDLQKKWFVRFPYEKVRKGSKVVLYGENEISIDYQKQMQKYCKLVAIVSDEWQHYDKTILPPEKLAELDFDVIVIAEMMNQERVTRIVNNIIKFTGRDDFIYDFHLINRRIN